MDRRTYLQGIGAVSIGTWAGCVSPPPEPTRRTYRSARYGG